MPHPPVFLEFRVRGVHVDEQSNTPVLLLEDYGGRVLVPIWIGVAEATAIAAELEGHRPPRPMTHDLFHLALAALDGRVARLDIRGVEEGTYLADLYITRGDGELVRLDCRPSDGVALALRARASIRVAAPVLDAAQAVGEGGEADDEASGPTTFSADDGAARARMTEALAAIDPKIFGKYKM